MKCFVSDPKNPYRLLLAILVAAAIPVILGAPFFIYVLAMIIGATITHKLNEYARREGSRTTR
jgi:hypothetical protein